MTPRPARNNLLAGLFVLGSLVLAVVVSFVLAERGAGRGATRFTVRFALGDGTAGLQPDSPVTLGGQPVGRVLGLGFAADKGVASGVDVRVEVRRDVTLFENASIFLEKPLLGTLSSINIASVGTEGAAASAGTARIESGETVPASLAPPAFLAQAGLGPMQVDQIRQTISDAQQAVDRLSSLIDKSSPEVETALTDARVLIADARANLASWDTSVDATLKNVEEASARLTPMLDKGDKVLTDADSAVLSAKTLFDDTRAVIADNRQRIDTIILDLWAAADKVNSDTVPLLTDALRDARAAMGEAQLAVSDVRDLVTQEGPSLRRTLANMRLMSDQLKLTAIEVRSHPWRLLHEPTTKELESQALYDATRSYAAAASDVRAAAETVQALTSAARRNALAGGDEATTQKLDEAGEALVKAMQGFRGAEQAFLSELVEREKK
jgi:ABC-type transporter Mla subunit MlaD